MTLTELITQAAEQSGMDAMNARDLHRALCSPAHDTLAARYAAEHVRRAMELYAEGDRIIAMLASLAA